MYVRGSNNNNRQLLSCDEEGFGKISLRQTANATSSILLPFPTDSFNFCWQTAECKIADWIYKKMAELFHKSYCPASSGIQSHDP
jgi:hypothetical protein